MNIEKLVLALCAYNDEQEWFEFKENWFQPEVLGEYVSALSNAAAFHHKAQAYFVQGVNDETHEITGTTFFCPCFLSFGELLTILWFWSDFDNRTMYACFVAQQNAILRGTSTPVLCLQSLAGSSLISFRCVTFLHDVQRAIALVACAP